MTNKEPLVSIDVSQRRQEKEKLIQTQQSVMNTKQVQTDTEQFNQSLDASKDLYLRDALTKVRESDVTIPDSLTRFHGTYIYRNK